jgi:hypothetical protein
MASRLRLMGENHAESKKAPKNNLGAFFNFI